MKTLIGIAVSVLGLFVEDGAFALATLAVVAAAGIWAVLIPNATQASGAILLVGCLGVLLLNVTPARRR
jgi:hypothetical protein